MLQKRVIAFTLLAFLSNFLMTTLLINGVAFYISHINSTSLSQSMIAVGLLVPLFVFSINYLFKKIAQEKAVALYFIALTLLVALASFLFASDLKPPAAVLFFIIAYSASQIISMVLWLLIEKHFNILDVKKYFSFFMGTEEIGTTSAALAIKFFWGGGSFFFICNIVITCAILMVLIIYTLTKSSPYSSMMAINIHAKIELKEFATLMRNQKIFRYLILIWCVVLMFEPCLLYEFGLSLEESGGKEAQFNEAMSLYQLYGSLCVFIFHYVISPYIFHRLTITHLLSFFCVMTSVVFILPIAHFDWRILLISMILDFTGFYTFFMSNEGGKNGKEAFIFFNQH